MTSEIQAPSIKEPRTEQTFELASKILGVGVFVTYICGYLITSIYHSQHGILQTNPFKPRIISAGAWFLLLTGIPVATVIEAMGGKRVAWRTLAEYIFPYWVACCVLSMFPATIFSFSADGSSIFYWKEIVALIISVAVYSLPNLRERKDYLSPILSILLCLSFLCWSLIHLLASKRLIYSSLILWFFFIGLTTMLELMHVEPSRLWDTRWIKTFFMGFLYLFIFAGAFYPHIKASWGGGAPVPVRIFFTKDSSINSSSSLDAFLIDEDDAGFYIKGTLDTNALFIPRNAVALISFSEANQKLDLPKAIANPTLGSSQKASKLK